MHDDGNAYADYHPFGLAYGTNAVYVLENIAYANYNGLQVAWIKTTGHLTFNLNGTWSKMLGTTIQQDPYTERGNYGPTAEDRPLVFNESYAYNSGTLHTGNNVLNQLGGGWTITGISTWQKGSYIPAVGSVNFGMGLQYTGLPADTSGASATRRAPTIQTIAVWRRTRGSPTPLETRRTSGRTRVSRSGRC